jgi:hypothetical protein
MNFKHNFSGIPQSLDEPWLAQAFQPVRRRLKPAATFFLFPKRRHCKKLAGHYWGRGDLYNLLKSP